LTRVLFLAESFYPVLGGGEQHIRSLGSRLAASGMPTLVVTRRGEPSWPAEEVVDGIRVVRVGPSGPARPGKYLMVPAAIAALVRERRRFDVLVVRGTRILGLPGLLVGRALGKAVVLQPELNGEMSGEVYTWGTPYAPGPLSTLVRWGTAVRNLWMRDGDAFVAMSERIREEFLAAGVSPERIALLPHGVDTDRFRPAGSEERRGLRERLGVPPEALLVTYTGRLLRGKGLESLLEAFGAAAAAEPRAHLALVGSGAGQALSIEDDLRRRVSESGLDRRVFFPGRVDDVSGWLMASDVFAFPSIFEALGISLIEAAACGLPCVGSRTGGIVDVIEDGRTGRLVAPGDTEGLRTAIESLMADPDLRRAMGEAGRRLARRRFDVRGSVDRYRGLFAEVSSRSGAWRTARAPRGYAAPPPSPASRA
jgi:glycosyltransferase involved in cell wall biosynthesis